MKTKRARLKARLKMGKIKPVKGDLLVELVGTRKAQFLRYARRKERFFQAQASRDLKWSINLTQYYLEFFVRLGFLSRHPTSYYTFYQYKNITLDHLL